jgi:HAE1 family hydrophobic/amphiphilic exporter-1
MYRFFINRPIVAMVIAILMVLVGLVSMSTLPIAQFPSVVPPEIRIQTTFVGADAETVQQSIATPIEEQMSGVDNMNYMYSINANNGVMRMVVNYDVKTDPRAAGGIAIAGGGAAIWRDHPEITDDTDVAGGALFAERNV